MRNMIAFCGLDCAACPAYMATQANDEEGRRKTAEKWSQELGLPITPEDCICDGCRPMEGARLGGYCNECPIRACGLKRGYDHCAQCTDYICDSLAKFLGQSGEARERLEALRAEAGK